MAKPVKYTVEGSKQEVIALFPDVIKNLDMQIIGCNNRLGIVSFRKQSEPLFYAHIVEQKDGKTQVSVAPGLPFLKEREQSEIPETRIKQILHELENLIKNHNK